MVGNPVAARGVGSGRRGTGRRTQTGFDGLCAAQRGYLDDFWARADVELDGDPEIQQAVRFSLFHVLQAGARAEGRAIPAKGLTGPGYNGHSFWDTEAYVLPVLTQVAPDAAAHALRWRHSTLPMATARATQLGLAGAAFPWRTIHGEECSSYWPAGTDAFHINADIADAVIRYLDTTGDQGFDRDVGVELLVETARLWASLGHHDTAGNFRIDGVTGPDEYSAIADNNIYTNLMAQQNLRAAAEAAGRHPDIARDLGVDDEEIAAWRDAAEAMCIPYDGALGVHPQSDGFTAHQIWDFAATTAGSTRCCCTSRISICTANRWSNRPTWCWPCTGARMRSPRSRRPPTSPTTNGSPSATPRCRPALRRCSPPRSDTLRWPMTTSPRRHSWTWTTWNTTPATACTSPPWPDAGSRWSPGWPGCATKTVPSRSRPAYPTH